VREQRNGDRTYRLNRLNRLNKSYILEQEFLKEGGLRKRMTKARLEVRARQRGMGNKTVPNP
jgi:four helix bundle suffix protein